MTIEVSANIASQPRSGGARAAGTRAKSQPPARAASAPYQIAKIVRRGSRLVTAASATLRDLTRHHALRDASPTRDADRQLGPHYRLHCRTCQPRLALARVWERIWSASCRRVSKPDVRSGAPLAAALPKGLDPEPFWPLSRRRCRMSGSQIPGHRKD